jgi:hypothetical protein
MLNTVFLNCVWFKTLTTKITSASTKEKFSKCKFGVSKQVYDLKKTKAHNANE